MRTLRARGAGHDRAPTSGRGPQRDGHGAGQVPGRQVLAGALAAAGGRRGRGHDVLDAVAGAGAAVVAGRPAAVGQADLGQRVLPVLPQEVLVEAGRDVVPRQDLVLGAVAVDVPLEVEAVVGHGLEPQVEAEVLAPLLERAAPPPHLLDDRAEAAVAPRRQALDEGGLGVVPGELHALGRPGARRAAA